MPAKEVIISNMELVARERGKQLPPLAGATKLSELGLDSLCFGILVARLEDELGFDPFTDSEEIYFPATFGELVQLYERGHREPEPHQG